MNNIHYYDPKYDIDEFIELNDNQFTNLCNILITFHEILENDDYWFMISMQDVIDLQLKFGCYIKENNE